MANQYIIAISREFGSGGKHIGRHLAKSLGVKLYDRNIIEHLAEDLDVRPQFLHKYEEKKRRLFFHRTVKGHTTALEDHVAQMQFDYIKKLADSGESFVIVGRCAESVLKNYEGMIPIFITGDREYRIGRVMKQFSLAREDAIEKMDRHDRTRRAYHNHHSINKWGDVKGYDLIVNATHFGTQGTAEFIEEYVKRRLGK